MLQARELTRRYGDFVAVQGVSFEVQEGEILGMLGPNGAGKTTTIRMLTGYLPPTMGSVGIAGLDLADQPRRARRQIGYMPENVALYPEMRVQEYLAYRGRLERMGRRAVRERIDEVADRCLLQEVRDQVIGTLSKGYRQRVGLAAAILHEPRVLVLDEPTVGLDPKQIIAIRELIRELGRSHTILLSTHILPEVELLCDRVLIIDRGRLVDQGTPEALRDRWQGTATTTITLKEDPPEAQAVLSQLEGVEAVRPDPQRPGRWVVEAAAGVDLREPLFRLAVKNRWVLLELVEEKASLEDIFVRLTTSDVAEPEGVSAAAEEGPAPAQGEPEEPPAQGPTEEEGEVP